MITFRITFLLAVDLKEIENSKTFRKMIKIKSGKSNKSSKRSFKSNKSNKSGKSEKTKLKKQKKRKKDVYKDVEKLEEEKMYTVIEVNEPSAYFHIEYQLFPASFKYGVDLVLWDSIVKIYSTFGTRCYKAVKNEDIVWIPVFIEHYLNQLSTEEVRLFFQHTISFSIKTGRNHVGALAKSDKNKFFYAYNEEVEGAFAEIFSKKPATGDDGSVRQEIERILQQLLAFPYQGEICSWIHNKNEVHFARISKIMCKRRRGEEIHCKNPIEDEEKSSKKRGKSASEKSSRTKTKSRSKKTSSKSSKEKKDPEIRTVMNFKIPAYIFVTDPVLATYQLKRTNSEVVSVYVLLNSENVLTRRQKQELNPLIVRIRKISNLPSNVLRQNGFDNIYLNCDIPNILTFDTAVKPLSDSVVFEESRLVCTDNVPPIQKMEFLQTQQVSVKILGLKEVHRNEKPVRKKKKVEETKAFPEPILLSTAYFDASSLSKSFFLFKEKGPCHDVRFPFSKVGEDEGGRFLDQFTVNELHLHHSVRSSPLTESALISSDTTLKIEMRFLVPQYPAFFVSGGATYKRFLAIVFDEDAAKLIFNSILIHNRTGRGPILFPNLYSKQADRQVNEHMLSGFVVDDGNCFVFFVEGSSNDYILSLLHQISTYGYSTAKVFYNSEYLFEHRLYTTFFRFNGFLVVTLKMPLCDIFARWEVYLLGNVPIPCLKAIQKLHLIFNSSTFKSILNHRVLPTECELASFSIEFGLQPGFKAKKANCGSKISQFNISDTDLFRM